MLGAEGVLVCVCHYYCCVPVAASRPRRIASIATSAGVRDLSLPSCTGSGTFFDHAGSHMSCRAGGVPLRSRWAPGEAADQVMTFGEVIVTPAVSFSLLCTLPPSFTGEQWLAVPPPSFSLLCAGTLLGARPPGTAPAVSGGGLSVSEASLASSVDRASQFS